MATIGFNKELVFTDSNSIPDQDTHNGASLYVGEPFNERLGFQFDGISTYIDTAQTLAIFDPAEDGRIEIIAGHSGTGTGTIFQNIFGLFQIKAQAPGGTYKVKVFQNSPMTLPNITTIAGHRVIFISWDATAGTATAGIKGVTNTYITSPMTSTFPSFALTLGADTGGTSGFFEGNMYGFKSWSNKDGLGKPDQAFEIDDGTDMLLNSGAIGTATATITNKTSSFWSLFDRNTRIDKRFLLTSSENIDGEAHYEGNWSPSLLYGDRCYFSYDATGDYRDTKGTPMLSLDFRITNCLGEAPVLDVIQSTISVNASVNPVALTDVTYNGIYEGSTTDVGGTVNVIEDVTNSAIEYFASANDRLVVDINTGDYTPNLYIPFKDKGLDAYIDVTYSAAVDETLFAPYKINGVRRADYNSVVADPGSLFDAVKTTMEDMVAGHTPDSIDSHALFSSITDTNDHSDPALPVGLSATLNPLSMFAAYDFTGCSFMYWNVNQTRWELSIDHTMLNARISMSCDHSNAGIGDTVVFRKADDTFQFATVLDLRRLNSIAGPNEDSITVTYYDQDITNVSNFKLVPSNFSDYAPTALVTNNDTPFRATGLFPIMYLGTTDLNLVQVNNDHCAWSIIRGTFDNGDDPLFFYHTTANLTELEPFSAPLVGGADSSCPIFLFADVGSGVEPLIFGMGAGTGDFQNVHPHITEIQAMIEEMVPGGLYPAIVADFSSYTNYS